MNDLVYELAENGFLRRQLKVIPPSSSAYRQMADAEYVLRFLTLAQTWRDFRGDLRGAFDSFMLKNRFASNDALDAYRHKFMSSITAAEAIWRERAFKRPGRDQALAGLFDAQMVALAELDSTTREVLIRERDTVVRESNLLFEDARFDEAVRIGTNTPTRLRERITVLMEALRRAAANSR